MVSAQAPAWRYDEVTTPSASKALSFLVVWPLAEVSMVKGCGCQSLNLHSIFPVRVVSGVVGKFAGRVNVEVEGWDGSEFGAMKMGILFRNGGRGLTGSGWSYHGCGEPSAIA